MSVDSTQLVITQLPNCQVSATAPGGLAPAAGETRTATVTANGIGCGWSTGSFVSWITIAGSATGAGSGTRQFVIAPYSGLGPASWDPDNRGERDHRHAAGGSHRARRQR